MAQLVYQGPSALDGTPILVAVTSKGRNVKTGPVDTLWVLHAGLQPYEAIRQGVDAAVCGDCPMRGMVGKARLCYVGAYTLSAVWRAALKQGGKVETIKPQSSILRVTGYGDPAAVPLDVLQGLMSQYKFNIGYTHQWRLMPNIGLLASVASVAEKIQANAQGFRTFRVKGPVEDVLPDEIVCPATTRDITCEKCKLCSTQSKAKNIVIDFHGTSLKSKAVESVLATGSMQDLIQITTRL